MTPINREQWLAMATEKLASGLFKQAGATIPEVRVSVGFPGGRSANTVIGQYWNPVACTDAIPQIFVSPVLADPIRALDVLVHELVHACTPGEGHKGGFVRLAKAIGLTGKMTATVAGPELTQSLNALSAELGPYPHGAIVDVHPAELFRRALAQRADGIILVHNHPGGTLEPSRPDWELTARVRSMCRDLGLKLHGHFIVTRDSSTFFGGAA